jgi:hypothetical protein
MADAEGVTFTPDFAVMEIKGLDVHGFNVYSNVWDVFSGHDSIVTAMGNDADDGLYFALKGTVAELYRVGDCVAPRKVDMAIHEGYMAGMRV